MVDLGTVADRASGVLWGCFPIGLVLEAVAFGGAVASDGDGGVGFLAGLIGFTGTLLLLFGLVGFATKYGVLAAQRDLS